MVDGKVYVLYSMESLDVHRVLAVFDSWDQMAVWVLGHADYRGCWRYLERGEYRRLFVEERPLNQTHGYLYPRLNFALTYELPEE